MDRPQVPDALAAYLDRIGRIPLLTPTQERELGCRVQAGRRTTDPEVFADARHAHAELVSANLRLVVALVRGVAGPGTALLDLVQEGNLALMRAADRFDPGRGYRFSTYAHDWIVEALRAAATGDRTVRLPPRARARLAHCRTARDELHALGVAEPGPADLARVTGYPEEEVRRLLRADLPHAPLESAALVAGADDDPGVAVVHDDRTQRLRAALARLEPRERRVVELRFGLDGQPCSRSETARRTGTDVGRVRRLEERALRRLRRVDGLAGLR